MKMKFTLNAALLLMTVFFTVGCDLNNASRVEMDINSDKYYAVSLELIFETEYDMKAVKEFYNLCENVSYLFMADVQRENDLLYFSRIGRFSFPDDFDFESYVMLVSYGRRIRELELINYGHLYKNSGLKGNCFSVTFDGEYFGNQVFFYQMIREKGERYVPTDYVLLSYIMEGTEKVRVYVGDINKVNSEPEGQHSQGDGCDGA